MSSDAEMIHIDCNCEFGYELQLVIPYAYYLHQRGRLGSTKSAKLTRELYYFSPNHDEKYSTRVYSHPAVPNKSPHVSELRYDEYLPPPYKQVFANTLFRFDKPLVVIHNKYNQEWGGPPVNYLDVPTLRTLFSMLTGAYTVIYILPNSKYIVGDNSTIHSLHDNDLLKEYGVIDGMALYDSMKESADIKNFNHFQLLLHASCDKFISVQGGNSVLASYFGGTNIIYAVRGQELACGAYNSHYRKYSQCDVVHVKKYAELIDTVKGRYLSPAPESNAVPAPV